HEHHVGSFARGQPHRFGAIRRLRDNLKFRIELEQRAQSMAHDFVIVGDEHANCHVALLETVYARAAELTAFTSTVDLVQGDKPGLRCIEYGLSATAEPQPG